MQNMLHMCLYACMVVWDLRIFQFAVEGNRSASYGCLSFRARPSSFPLHRACSSWGNLNRGLANGGLAQKVPIGPGALSGQVVPSPRSSEMRRNWAQTAREGADEDLKKNQLRATQTKPHARPRPMGHRPGANLGSHPACNAI